MSDKDLWKNLKNPISIVAGLLIIVCIMSFPVLYFKQVDASRYNTRHYMKKISFKLDTDVENVLMVSRLHRILNSPYQIDISTDEVSLKTNEITLTVTNDYEMENVIREKDGGMLILGYDTATDKVVQAKYKKKNYNRKKYIDELCTAKGDNQMKEELSQFLEHLGLNLIEDWYYESVWEFYGNYEEAIKAVDEQEWCIVSPSAKLKLYAKPEKDGVKYYFDVDR